MRKLLVPLVLLSSLVIGGCRATPIPSPNDPTFPAVVQEHRSVVKNDSIVAVSVFLGLTSDDKERAKTGALAYEVASLVNESVKKNEVTIVDVRGYASKLLSKGDSQDQQRAGLILNAVVAVIQNHVDVKLKLDGEVRATVVRELVLGATEGVMESTEQFKNTAPARAALPKPVQS